MFNPNAVHNSTEDGVWADYENAQFLIRHTSSVAFQRALSREQQPHRKKIAEGSLDPAVNKKLVCKAMADALLLDWRAGTGFEGSLPTYTPEIGLQALNSQPAFRDFVSDFSMHLTNFIAEETKEVGNS